MVNNSGYVNIRIVLDRLLRHPLLTDLNLEAAIQYTIDFISAMGLPHIHIDKVETVKVDEYRGLLPCDLVSINQVRLHNSNTYLRSMTDNFNGHAVKRHHDSKEDLTFKTQGNVIFTSTKCADLDISYRALPLDEDGLPLLPDNAIFLKTLELYIKKEWFTILFDLGRISPAVLSNTQQSYAFVAGQCNNEFLIPSVSEMESITNSWNQLIPRTNEFRYGFKNLGNKEYIRSH